MILLWESSSWIRKTRPPCFSWFSSSSWHYNKSWRITFTFHRSTSWKRKTDSITFPAKCPNKKGFCKESTKSFFWEISEVEIKANKTIHKKEHRCRIFRQFWVRFSQTVNKASLTLCSKVDPAWQTFTWTKQPSSI